MKVISIVLLMLFFYCQPVIAQKSKINHIALHVTHLEKSTHFYHKVLELDTIPEPFKDGKHTWLSMGYGVQLHLIESLPQPVIPLKNTHICISVPSVAEFVKKLSAQKIHWEDWAGTKHAITTRKDGVLQIYLRDPDGYWIEVNDAYN